MSENYTNRLIHESSPYLLQHAHNPVDWHPWNEDTLAKARSMDRMLLISIGYAACHWCHVMEKESFMDREVAEVMNRYFICIKVDREERPDLDQVYMNAIQLITGSGGWPLNCFALPDGRPFFGGTYFRRSQWMQLMENVHLLFKERRKDLEEQANALTRGVMDSELVEIPVEKTSISAEGISSIIDQLKIRFDHKDGGMTGSPKFPMPVILSFLLHSQYYHEDREATAFLKTTLLKMAYGGIYDQIGGGFARYSTDSQWRVPHFEKMLYDNAQLVSLYSNAWKVWKNTLYRDTVEETLSFVLKEMAHPSGGFYSSLDADSEGVEGRYYTWAEEEFKKVVGPNADLVGRYYQVGGRGTWEDGHNILLRHHSTEEFAQQVGLQPSQFRKMLGSARNKLMKERQKRVRPALDDKVLTSWNGLMLSGFVDAFTAFDKERYLVAAVGNARFLIDHMMQEDGRLLHTWKSGKGSVNGFLEDYCFMAEGLIALYQCTFQQEYVDTAMVLAEYAIKHFYDQGSGLFYVTSSLDPPLIARKKEIYDNVVPSSNSSMAKVLFQLGMIYEREDLADIAARMRDVMLQQVVKYPSAYPNWASVQLSGFYPFHTLAITGAQALEKAKEVSAHYLPNLVICGSFGEPGHLPVLENRFHEGETILYLCTGKDCRLPTDAVAEVLRQLK